MAFHHPPKDQLIAFGQGTLATVESSHIEQHLEVCHECCETLLDLKDDTFVGLVKTASGRSADPANVRTDPGTDAGSVRDDSVHAATILEQSGESTGPEELSPQLAGHPRYDIVEQIGRGGMGNVYRAWHRLMNRPVAIKLINSQLIQNPHAVERFRREVQAAAKLSHPNIVAAYDAEQAGNSHFLVMEFVEGTDLASVVIQRGPMSVAEACECIRQVATGLQHAHEKGMVHRDIKPHNLMLAAGGQVRILDFGLAGFVTEATAENIGPNALASGSGTENAETDKPDAIAYQVISAAHLTMAGSVMGTPDYIAPEQAVDAHSADIRADIYSLGCTLHFLLTGKPPFEADNVVMKLKAHANEPPPSLTALRSDVPTELAAVAARMMAKNPDERFQTPAEVAAALALFAQPAIVPPKRRGRTLIAAALMGVMALVAGVIYVEFDKGQFVIETADDQVSVSVGEKGVKIRDAAADREYFLKPGPNRIRSGEYEIVVTELPAGLEFSPVKTFRLKRGGIERVKVSFRRTDVARTDNELLQGVWSLTSFQVGKRKFDEKELAGQAAIVLTIADDKFSMKRIALAGDRVPADTVMRPAALDGQFFLDTARTPKQISVMVPKDNLNSLLGIYRIEGDRLTLCCFENPDSNEYPTEFATKSGSRAVLYDFRRDTVTTKPQPPQSRAGLLTNPPKLPPEGLAVGRNLIVDPSLERTPTGQLPNGWFAWLDDGPDFKCEVVEGGVTGKHCLQISGTGTRGVVFATSIPLDRTKRYALKGHVKVEGDAGTWAVIKLNYFNDTGWLGVDDRIGVTSSDLDWKLLEKTDLAEKYPTATLLVPTCHIEGNGTAWFDDLEVVAYDRDKLPADFDAKQGRNNRMK